MGDGLISRCLDMARRSAAFHASELDVLAEVLQAWKYHPDEDYSLLVELEEGRPAGFLIYGDTPMTAFGVDLYWIVTDPDLQRRGVGARLVRQLERALLFLRPRAVIRVETSGRDAYAGQQQFYEAAGFRECGRIPDFYDEGDDLVFFCRSVGREALS